MKKFFTYCLALIATASATSCTAEMFSPDKEDSLITLRLQTAAPETRAIDPESVENVLNYADFFFFSD